MGAYSAKDLEGGDELQIRFQPLLLCPNLHQGLIAKAVCEYVPEVERSDNCDDVVRGVTPREVSVIVSLLSRKYNGSPSRNAERDLKSSCCCKLCHTHTHTVLLTISLSYRTQAVSLSGHSSANNFDNMRSQSSVPTSNDWRKDVRLYVGIAVDVGIVCKEWECPCSSVTCISAR